MDQLEWLWQDMVSWIITLVVAAMLGVARKYRPSVAAPVLYAIIGGGVIFVCLWLPARLDRHLEALEVLTNGRPTRPYFTQTQAAIQDVLQSTKALTVSVQNNDIPAQNVVSQLLVLEESLDPTIEPIHTKRIENANIVGPSGTLSQYWFVDVKRNARPAYILFQIRYADALSNETYSQALFLKFLGSSQAGTFIQQLVNASSDEKTRIERYLMERGIPSLLSD